MIDAPLNVSWADGVTPTSIEEGGFERVLAADVSAQYYLVGGGGGSEGMAYSMWVWRSDRIDGPYSPVTEGFRLSGGVKGSGKFGWLAAWCGPSCDGKGNPLISNYITPSRSVSVCLGLSIVLGCQCSSKVIQLMWQERAL